ncbi:hypothetical protein VP1G_10908 [Cytospora mali]|uniref:Uncharacterized protein n=1 Tax=Cytospora mali TaxID=578113 RepID=A0A194UZV1_CYTMA|nr:hypothetical protein VP1G_10908 [Valsa mali var. pyri (nom. inval.)]
MAGSSELPCRRCNVFRPGMDISDNPRHRGGTDAQLEDGRRLWPEYRETCTGEAVCRTAWGEMSSDNTYGLRWVKHSAAARAANLIKDSLEARWTWSFVTKLLAKMLAALEKSPAHPRADMFVLDILICGTGSPSIRLTLGCPLFSWAAA